MDKETKKLIDELNKNINKLNDNYLFLRNEINGLKNDVKELDPLSDEEKYLKDLKDAQNLCTTMNKCFEICKKFVPQYDISHAVGIISGNVLLELNDKNINLYSTSANELILKETNRYFETRGGEILRIYNFLKEHQMTGEYYEYKWNDKYTQLSQISLFVSNYVFKTLSVYKHKQEKNVKQPFPEEIEELLKDL